MRNKKKDSNHSFENPAALKWRSLANINQDSLILFSFFVFKKYKILKLRTFIKDLAYIYSKIILNKQNPNNAKIT